jgi:dipeptide transport system permease protein
LAELDRKDMLVTSLRFATACGMSDLSRLDPVLNVFVARAITSGEITVLSDGTPWRPLIAVEDMARAILCAIRHRRENGGEFPPVNAGRDESNYPVPDLAEAVARHVPGTTVSTNTNAPPDNAPIAWTFPSSDPWCRTPFCKCRWISPSHGDFGVSLSPQQKLLTEFLTLFPATLELSLFAMLFAIAIGVPAGALAAVQRGGFYDEALMMVSLFGYSMPIFWWGLLLHVRLREAGPPASFRPDRLHQLFLRSADWIHDGRCSAVGSKRRFPRRPASSDSAGDRAWHRAARRHRPHDSLLDARSAERGLRANRARQGVNPARVIGVHALRNALLPVVTAIGLSLSGLMAGAVLTETILSWPGVGHWLIDSIGRRDYPALQGGVLLISAVVVFVNLIVDLVYGVIDPRIRHAR